jgi:hypothetical protein
VLRSLTSDGKIVIAGDSEQLAPILAAQYPILKTGSLFGSVLDSLMYLSKKVDQEALDSQSTQATIGSSQGMEGEWSQSVIIQLTENFR